MVHETSLKFAKDIYKEERQIANWNLAKIQIPSDPFA